MSQIEKAGFDILNEVEKNSFDRLSSDYMQKIEMKLKNISSLKVHFKEHHVEGSRKKYSLHAKIILPGKFFEASADDWDFARTVHQLFKKIEEEIENRFRPSDQNKR